MKAYFKHQLKSNTRAIIVISLLAILISVFVAFDSMDRERSRKFVFDGEKYYSSFRSDINGNPVSYQKEVIHNEGDNRYFEFISVPITDEEIIEVKYRELTLSTSMTVLIILSIAVPVWVFAFLKKKRNLDCAYSLPITKRGIGMVQYAVGAITVFIPFVCAYVATLICYASFGSFAALGHGYLISHFAISLLMGFVLYSISVFVFERANSVVDGIVLICAYMVGLYFLVYGIEGTVNGIVHWHNDIVAARFNLYLDYSDSYIYAYEAKWSRIIEEIFFQEDYAVPAYFFGELLSNYEYCAQTVYSEIVAQAWERSATLIWFIIWSAVGLLSAGGAIYFFDKKKAESAEEISGSAFGYKVLIPLLAFPIIIADGILEGEFTEALLITVGSAVAYTVYRRGVRYKKSDYIIVGIMLVLSIASIFVEPAFNSYLSSIRRGVWGA